MKSLHSRISASYSKEKQDSSSNGRIFQEILPIKSLSKDLLFVSKKHGEEKIY